MIDVRAMRDVGFAVLLAVPTVALTRPFATESVTPAARQSPLFSQAAVSAMGAEQRRVQLPTTN